MKIKLLRNTVADGQTVCVGQIVEVSDATGKALVQMNKAAMVLPDPAPPAAEPTEPIKIEPDQETVPDQIEMAAPPPTRRAKGKGSK